MLKSLSIEGLRGFSTKQTMEFSVPESSNFGLTIITGGNNSGKSTVIEALRALAQSQVPSFSQGRRNLLAGDRVELKLENVAGQTLTVRSLASGTSEAEHTENGLIGLASLFFALPSRRVFAPYFSKNEYNREQFQSTVSFTNARSSQNDSFSYRLFRIAKKRTEFDALLKEVTGIEIDWSIDQSDQGNYFLKIKGGDGGIHNSEGMGEGLVSLLYIVDALYDSEPGQTIAIDEPELSLHPEYQRGLQKVLLRLSLDRQIIVATHSPYFVDMSALAGGISIHRVTSGGCGSEIHSLSAATASAVSKLINNQNNPHIVGLNARETFFLGDKVVLLEGQEDVLFLDRALDATGLILSASRFGWGVGGADNMEVVAQMLSELGFTKVIGILDSDKADVCSKLRTKFPEFHFDCQPAKDIRTKKAVAVRPAVAGLLDDTNSSVRPEHLNAFTELIIEANKYLKK